MFCDHVHFFSFWDLYDTNLEPLWNIKGIGLTKKDLNIFS